MNLTVGLGKLFDEKSTGVPALLPCSQLPMPWTTSRRIAQVSILGKQGELPGNCLPNLTVRFILDKRINEFEGLSLDSGNPLL